MSRPVARAVLTSLALLAAAACAHAPAKLTPEEEGQILAHDLKVEIAKELGARTDLRKIRSIELVESELNDAAGLRKFAYRVSFESASDKYGAVNNDLELEATLIRTGEQAWKVDSIEPKSQKMVFDTPAVIFRPDRKR